ncbi:GerMN domain-containing protein [Kitasatospora sp. HPMI-4]|uniref:GerMN domain-containing protein n=1 Tax=Kitasatospora sp. HPMI-4 TaxID=3448443 RepID=UPI003F1DB092
MSGSRRLRAALTAGTLLLLAGCGMPSTGVPPTGVLDGGPAASGLTKGLRIYFVGDDGLRGVARPGVRVQQLGDVFKLLAEGPSPAEQRAGLTTLMWNGPYSVEGDGRRVTVRAPGISFEPGRDQKANGQLVCSLARAQSLLVDGVRPNDVQVTLVGSGRPVGPFPCSYYLGG